MKEYYKDGLLPEAYIEEAFKRLQTIKSGTLGEAFEKTSQTFARECREDFYNYTYELEGYINELIRKNTSTTATLGEIIERAVADYILDIFHDNLYTYLENHLEMLFLEEGLLPEDLAKLNLLSLIGYADDSTSIARLRKRARKYIKQAC